MTNRIYLDPAVSHINDPRIQLLTKGRISMQKFLNMLRRPDWLVLDGNIVRLIPRYQYITMVRLQNASTIPQHVVLQVMQGNYDHAFPPQVLTQLHTIRKNSEKCSACALKRYKNTIRQLISLYIPEHSGTALLDGGELQYPAYGAGLPAVFTQDTRPIRYSLNRAPCFDCIQKHIGQAYITAKQAALGYPQHMMLCYGHLAQAIQQCPQYAQDLKASLTLCLGKTQQQGHLFLPLMALYNLIQLHRTYGTQSDVALRPNEPDPGFSINIIDSDISNIPYNICQQLIQAFDNADKYAIAYRQGSGDRDTLCTLWRGQLARISEILLQYDQVNANIIRNIRIMFSASPQYMLQQDLGIQRLLTRLRQSIRTRATEAATAISTEQNTAPQACEPSCESSIAPIVPDPDYVK